MITLFRIFIFTILIFIKKQNSDKVQLRGVLFCALIELNSYIFTYCLCRSQIKSLHLSHFYNECLKIEQLNNSICQVFTVSERWEFYIRSSERMHRFLLGRKNDFPLASGGHTHQRARAVSPSSRPVTQLGRLEFPSSTLKNQSRCLC